MKWSIIFCCLLFSFVSFTQNKKVSLVLDAGHGGHDTGFLSENKNHLTEKELNLIISNKVGSYISQYLTNIEIIYTRTDDSFVSLDDRVAKANVKKADYFISIHCNASERKVVHGTESHVHTMDSEKSVDFATIMEKEFSAKAGRNSRGVKDSDDREHSLQVLKYTNMTGVLLECGFLSNEKEANYLNTTEGQDILASAIFRGIRTFLQKEYPAINFVKNAPAKPVVAATAKTNSKETKETKIPAKDPTKVSAKPTTEPGAFSIQIMSSRDPIDPSDVAFRKLGEPVVRQKVVSTSEFIYRYLLGNFDSREEGAVVLKKVQSNGFKDAIIIQTE